MAAFLIPLHPSIPEDNAGLLSKKRKIQKRAKKGFKSLFLLQETATNAANIGVHFESLVLGAIKVKCSEVFRCLMNENG